MEWVENIPALVKIILVLVIVVGALKFRVSLSLSMLLGGIFLGVFFQMSPATFGTAVFEGIISIDTISLVIIVGGILILSNAMSVSGRLERIVTSFKCLVGGSRISLVTFPALIGLLPMPGGAVFSAPMVGAISENTTLPPNHKTIINYWFRHIWEYWFPLYPGVILAITLTHIPAWKFILLNMPMTIISLIVGYVIILRHISLSNDVPKEYSRKNIRGFINELIPILLMVGTLLILGILINLLQKLAGTSSKAIERLPILVGLGLSISWVVIADKLEWEKVKSILLKRSVWELGLLVSTIMVFRSLLEHSGGVETLKNELLTYHIPVIGLVMVLPFIAGILTGIAIGFVGVSFPIVITLIATMGEPMSSLYAPLFIAYVFGYIGMMLSPVHLCLLLTKDYFKANLLEVYYRYLIPLGVIIIMSALLIFLLYTTLKI